MIILGARSELPGPADMPLVLLQCPPDFFASRLRPVSDDQEIPNPAALLESRPARRNAVHEGPGSRLANICAALLLWSGYSYDRTVVFQPGRRW